MTDPEHPHEDPDLSALYRRTPRHEPGAASDHLIRAAAHAAVSKTRRQRHLIAPWAVAATLVLSIGIGWQVFHEPDLPDLADPVERLAVPEAADEAPLLESQAPVQAEVPPEPVRGEPLQTAPQPAAAYSERLSADAERGLFDGAVKQSLPRPSPATQGIAEPRQRKMLAGAARAVPTAPTDCEVPMPEKGATQAQWDAAFAAARRNDEDALLLCLRQQYERHFGRPYSTGAE